MKYRIQYYDGNPNKITIHLDISLAHHLEPVKVQKWTADYDDFEDKCETPFFLKRIIAIHGIEDAFFDCYSITIEKGDLFSWRQLISHIIFHLQVNFNHGRPVEKKHGRQRLKINSELRKGNT